MAANLNPPMTWLQRAYDAADALDEQDGLTFLHKQATNHGRMIMKIVGLEPIEDGKKVTPPKIRAGSPPKLRRASIERRSLSRPIPMSARPSSDNAKALPVYGRIIEQRIDSYGQKGVPLWLGMLGVKNKHTIIASSDLRVMRFEGDIQEALRGDTQHMDSRQMTSYLPLPEAYLLDIADEEARPTLDRFMADLQNMSSALGLDSSRVSH